MPHRKSLVKRARHALERAGLRLLVQVLPLLSRRLLVGVANAAGAAAATLDRRGRAVALANLECTIGRRFGAPARRRIVRQSYQNFALTMLSLFWSRHLNGAQFQRWIDLEGLEMLNAHLKKNRQGVILLCVHEGNWEWAAVNAGFIGLQATIPARGFKNAALAAIFSAARQQSGNRVIAQEGSMLRLFRQLKRGRAVGLLCDLSFVRDGAATVVDAWGLKMAVPVLPAALALRTGALLVPAITEPLADGRCKIKIHRPIKVAPGDSSQQVAQKCWNFFQHEIDQRPGLWLWPYKHFRHRPRVAASAYPFYANTSGAFERLLAASQTPADTLT